MTDKVLLLDDDTLFCSIISRALRGVGLDVTTVPRGAEATAILEGGSDPDLIIVDGLLPDTNGVQWIEALRQSGDDRKIVFVSAFYRDLNTFRHLTRDLGVARVYHKPLSVERFAREVAQLMPGAKLQSQPERPLVDPQEGDHIIYPEDVGERRHAQLDQGVHREALPDQVHAMARAVDLLRGDRDRPSLVDEALRTMDALHKTATALHDQEIAAVVADLEEQLRRLKRTGTSDWTQLSKSIDALEQQVGDPARKASAAASPVVTPAATRLLHHDAPESVVPTLLVLEDDPAMVAYLRAAFEDLLVHVRTSHSSTDALSIAAGENPSAVLIGWPLRDEQLVTDFLSACRGVRGSQACRVIMLSVDDSVALRQRAATWGIDYFVPQPVDPSVLRHAVERALRSVHHREPSVMVVNDTEAADQLEAAGFKVYRTGDLDEAANTLQIQRVPVVLAGVGVAEVTTPAVLRMSAWDLDFSIVAFRGSGLSKAVQVDALLDRDSDWVGSVNQLAQRVFERRGWCFRCPTTGLAQRAGGLAAVESGLAYAQRHGLSYGVAMLRGIGLDTPDANVRYAVDSRLGRTLSTRFRREDARARWDETTFFVGLEGPDANALSEVVRRFQDEIAIQLRHDGFEYDNFRLAGGVATYPLDGDTVRSLVLRSYERLQDDLK